MPTYLETHEKRRADRIAQGMICGRCYWFEATNAGGDGICYLNPPSFKGRAMTHHEQYCASHKAEDQ